MRSNMTLSEKKRLDTLLAGARARAAGAAAFASAIPIFAGDGATLGPLTGTTTAPIDLAAFDVTPLRSGLFLVNFTVAYVLSAADTLNWLIDEVPAVTNITSGGSIRTTFRYETTPTPLVVTGGTPVPYLSFSDEVATGEISAHTMTLSGYVLVPALNVRAAIKLSVSTVGGAHLTTLGITNAGVLEL